MAFDAGAVVGTIELRYDKAVKSLKAVEQQTQRTMGKMSKFVKDHREQIGAYGRTMVIASAAVAGAFALVTRKAIEFDAAMRNVNTIARLTERGLADVMDEVTKLSMETGEAATVLAAGLYDIFSAGHQGAAALDILAASARAAVAGISDTATAAGALLTALASWDIEASRVSYVSDVLFKTIEKGRIDFQQLAMTLSMGAGMAKDAGVSLEEFGAAVATATARTIRARSAGEYFRQMMTSLVKPSEALKTAIEVLNKRITEFEFATGKSMIIALGLGRTMQELKRYSDETGVGMEQLFSEATALQFALALTSDEGKLLITNMQAMDKASGATGDAFEEQGRAVARQMKIMKESVNALAITVGHTLLPSITRLINQLVPMVQGWIQFAKANHELIRSVSLTTLKLTAVAAAIGIIVIALSSPQGLIAVLGALSSALIIGAMHWDEFWAAMAKTRIELPAHVIAWRKLQAALEEQAEAQSRVNQWVEFGLTPMYEQIIRLRDATAAVIAARAEYEKLAGANREVVKESEELERHLADLQKALEAIGGAADKLKIQFRELDDSMWLWYKRTGQIVGDPVWDAFSQMWGEAATEAERLRETLAAIRFPPLDTAAQLWFERTGQMIDPVWQKFEEMWGAAEDDGKKVATEIDKVWEHTLQRLQDGFANTIAQIIKSGGGLKEWWTGLGDMFRNVWAELLASLATMWFRDFINRLATKWLGEALFPVAAAGASFQHGGIVTKPTIALVGEAGPEKITPLTGPMAGQGAGGAPINITIQAIDTQSGLDFLMRNRREIGMAVQGAFRDFAPVRRGG